MTPIADTTILQYYTFSQSLQKKRNSIFQMNYALFFFMVNELALSFNFIQQYSLETHQTTRQRQQNHLTMIHHFEVIMIFAKSLVNEALFLPHETDELFNRPSRILGDYFIRQWGTIVLIASIQCWFNGWLKLYQKYRCLYIFSRDFTSIAA